MGAATVISDEELILQVQHGDRRASELLARRYWQRVRALAYRLVRNWEAAEDLAQETFVRLLSAIDRYRHPEPVWPWLYTITLNLCRDFGRRASQRLEWPADEATANVEAPGPDPTQILEDRDERARVVQALQRLSPKHREVLTLRFYEQLTLREIAGRCGIPLGTVKSRLSWALRRLRALLTVPVPGND